MISISIEANNFDKKLSILIKPIFNRIKEFVINVLNNQHFRAVYIICMQPFPITVKRLRTYTVIHREYVVFTCIGGVLVLKRYTRLQIAVSIRKCKNPICEPIELNAVLP